MGKSLDVLGCSDPCGARCGRASVLFCAEKGGRGEVLQGHGPDSVESRDKDMPRCPPTHTRHTMVYACTHVHMNSHTIDTTKDF